MCIRDRAGLHVPVMLLVDVVGNGLVPPAHCAGIAANVGVTGCLIVTVTCVVVAHWPAAGVNVYCVVVLGSKAGLHVPVMLLVDVVGSGLVPPAHCAGIAANVGVTGCLIVTVTCVVVAHWPAAGVNVYCVVVLGSKAGLHVPVMLLVDVVGSGLVPPAHCAGIAANVGVTGWLIVTVTCVVVAHWPAAGVNVYCVVVLGSKAGLHVPVMLLVDVVGNGLVPPAHCAGTVSYTHLRAHETPEHLVCRLLLE